MIKPWKDIQTSGQIFCKRSESSMPQQSAASHQASQELEAPPADLQVVNPSEKSVNIAVCPNDVTSAEASETYVLGNTIR